MTAKSLREHLSEFLRLKSEADESEKNSQPYGDYYNKYFLKLKKLSKRYADDKTFPTIVGEKPENKPKNRYKDILPFDQTRVVLDIFNNDPHSDYINANFVKDVYSKEQYIAAQGPMPTTLNDFWRMIWQQEIKVVVMACNEYEGMPGKCSMDEAEKMFLDPSTPQVLKPKLRCKRYWATEDKPLILEDLDLKVTLVDCNIYETGEYTVRKLKAVRGGKERSLTQIHYEGWPDHGVPPSPYPLLDMIVETREYQPFVREGPPLLVHCSAGCGRTGTILVIDYCWNLIRTAFASLGNRSFDLHNLLYEMRQMRPSIVQSAEQYKFVYDAVAQIFKRQLAALDDNIYANVSDESEEEEVVEEDIYENVQSGDYGDDYNGDAFPRPKIRRKPGRRTIQAIQSYAVEYKETVDTDYDVPQNNRQVEDAKPPISPNKPKPPISSNKPLTPTNQKPQIPATKPIRQASEDTSVYCLAKDSRAQPVPGGPRPVHRSSAPVATSSDHVTTIQVKNDGHSSVPRRKPNLSATYSEPADSGRVVLKPAGIQSSDTYSVPFNAGPSNVVIKVKSPKAKAPPETIGASHVQDEYSYADPKNPNKWSLQHIALQKQTGESEYASAAYDEVEIGKKKTEVQRVALDHHHGSTKDEAPTIPERPPDLFPSQHPFTRTLSGSDTLSKPQSIGRSKGNKIKNTLNEMLGLPKAADPSVTSSGDVETVHYKDSNISYPNRVDKPAGPRNPKTFELPRDLITKL